MVNHYEPLISHEYTVIHGEWFTPSRSCSTDCQDFIDLRVGWSIIRPAGSTKLGRPLPNRNVLERLFTSWLMLPKVGTTTPPWL